MISTTDIFDAASRNPEVYTLRYLGTGLYILHMEEDRNNGLLPQKMNSYGVLKVIDPTWYGMQYDGLDNDSDFEGFALAIEKIDGII
jgi:hypothetical protein